MTGFKTTAGGGLTFAENVTPKKPDPVNLYSNWVRTAPMFRDFRPMELGYRASGQAHDLSLTDWRKWLPWAVPAFNRTFLQIDPRAYIPGDDIVEALVITNNGPSVQMTVVGKLNDKAQELMSPFTINFELDPKFYVPVEDNIARLGWGPQLVDKWGMPDMPRVGGNPARQLQGFSKEQLGKICYEFAGQVRVALAAMALINMHGNWEDAPESAPLTGRKRSKLHKAFIPTFGVHTVTLDLRKKKSKPKRAGTTGTPKCEHDVRGHFKHYRTDKWKLCGDRHQWNATGPRQVCSGCGSRRKWVEGFRKGDPERGSTVAWYEIR